MISCSAASSEKSRVSWFCGTSCGYSDRTAGMIGGVAAPPSAPRIIMAGSDRGTTARITTDDTARMSVTSSTGIVPNRLSCRETIGPATAVPIENAASTRPAEV